MATATSKLQIIVDVLGDKANASLKGIQGSLSQIAVVTGTVVAAGYAAKQAWDFTKEGAELEKTAGQFRNVAENAGYAADVLLNEMRAATGGLVSDAELIASGLNIIELGLADSQQGVVDLATVVSTLGLDMQQVIMTFANDSVMRLDALGLSVETVTKRAKELEAQGFSGDAFDQAVLEGLQERMAVLGDVTETTAGKMQKFETTLKNVLENAKKTSSEGLAPLIDWIDSTANAQILLENAYERGIISADEFNRMGGSLGSTLEDNARIVEYLTERIREYEDSLKDGSNELSKWPGLFNHIAEEMQLTRHHTRELAYDTSDLVISIVNGAGSARELANGVTSMGGSFEQAGKQASGAIQPVSGLLDGINSNIASPIDAFIQDLEWLIGTGGEFEETFEAIQNANVTPEQKLEWAEDLLEDATAAKDAIDGGNDDDLAAAIAGLDDIQLEMSELEEAKAKAQEFDEALRRMQEYPYTIDVEVNYNINGDPPGIDVPTGGGGGPGSGDGSGIDSGGYSVGFPSAGGYSSDIFIDTLLIVASDDRTMKNMIRDAASAKAGASGVNYNG